MKKSLKMWEVIIINILFPICCWESSSRMNTWCNGTKWGSEFLELCIWAGGKNANFCMKFQFWEKILETEWMTLGRKADCVSICTGKWGGWILWRFFLIASIFSVQERISSAESENRWGGIEVWGVRCELLV